jgi:hypothetical protein
MKTRLILTLLLMISMSSVWAQLKKDGTPDMRYKANKAIYGTPSSYTPSPSYYTAPKVNYQQNYYNSSGTYVEPHYKTNSNNTNLDNYSTSGNINPYTGQSGSKAQEKTPEAFNYGKGYEIKQGSNGGQYYINTEGKKIYVPKRY